MEKDCQVRGLNREDAMDRRRLMKHRVHHVHSFAILNGARQDGALSPLLFYVYIDDLLQRISKSAVGCYLDRIFVGALAYAHDVVLVCLEIRGFV